MPYIKQVVPGFLNVIRTVDDNFREYLLLQLGVLINIVGQHIQNYMHDIYLLIDVSILYYLFISYELNLYV